MEELLYLRHEIIRYDCKRQDLCGEKVPFNRVFLHEPYFLTFI